MYLLGGALIIVYLVLIILACLLFTNAIENLGTKLKLGNNAVGSVLAVIGTTLPETIVPIVAIIGSIIFKNNSTGSDVALGAIIGSPFMLSTLALSLIGISLLIFRKEKELNVNKDDVIRFYKYFLITYIIGISTTFISNYTYKVIIAALLILSYVFFVKRTIKKSKDEFSENETDELLLNKLLNIKKENIFTILIQVIFSLILLVISSHLFVEKIIYFSNILKVSPIFLSLVITPFATELPECINSIIWTKNNKDDLALANVLGAVVFQSVVPMSIGILFTSWILDSALLLNSIIVVFCSLFMLFTVLISKKVKLIPLILCLIFYVGYLVFIFLK